jgi:hypothetical protein
VRSNEALAALGPWAVAAVCAVVVAGVRPALAERYHELRATNDVYALPDPERVVVASLGYRSALADLIWGNLHVSYGRHFQEKRRFELSGSIGTPSTRSIPRSATPTGWPTRSSCWGPSRPGSRTT